MQRRVRDVLAGVHLEGAGLLHPAVLLDRPVLERALVQRYLDRHVLFKLHWGGRGVKGEAWRELVEGTPENEGFAPRLDRMWREQDYLHPRARLGYFPCNSEGNELIVFDPEDPERELERLVFPRQPKHDRICLADFYRPLESGERDVVALQGVTVGPEVTELIENSLILIGLALRTFSKAFSACA